ncbi:DNA translocase FtsK [uncultured Endozoicomonas sp.]|uniref:DNA translocase FtsK n=1 Tax=uncultured Endozoicomonas sp. TaxID=432652 RepID=UPI002638A3E0|nr:DNA translocase FtsK [uncultured Endozoicomonas sp.]
MAESVSKKSSQSGSDSSVDQVAIRRRKRSGHSEKVSETLSSRVQEGIMFCWLVLAAFLSLALFSYHKGDPGWSFIGTADSVANSAGRIGAWSSDFLLNLFGFLAWLVPVVFILKAVKVFRYRHEPNEWHGWLFTIRSTGFVLTIASGAALASLHYHALNDLFPSSTGGIIGELIISVFIPAFNVTGSTLLLMASFLLGVTLYTDLSWFYLMDTVGYWSMQFLKFCQRKTVNGFRRIKEYIAERSERKHAAESIPVLRKDPVMPITEELPSPAAIRAVKEAALKPRSPVIVPPPPKVKPVPVNKNVPVGRLPTADLLDVARPSGKAMSPESLDQMSRLLELKLKDFNVDVEVVAVLPGPVITRFEIQPAPGTKASKISGLASDLARSLAVVSVRVVEVIPGKSVMGIEIPNDDRETVFFSEIISSPSFESAPSPVSLALGHDISGQPVTVDLAKMPHLLVAGTTGSGKSVGINAMLLSMLFKSEPEDVRLIMIDPKMLELSIYDGIPHLLAPVVTDMKEAANALRWCVAEMERRYKLMAHLGVRNIAGYNRKVKDAADQGEPLRDPFYQPVSSDDIAPELNKLPFIVVVVDEFADMMMIVGKKVEELIARIAQKARAAGIHLILATQRPSVDVITGLIKANVPTRISFQVSSKIDSRTIIDQGGAEQLLGHGDMLYLPPGTSVPVRIHGAFVGDDEVHRVVADWQQRGEPDFVDEILNGVSDASEGSAISGGLDDSEQDPLYDEAVAFVTESRRASISSVQRQLKVGYNRAARMVEAMEAAGVVSPPLHNGNRDVIAPPPPKN